MKARGDIPIILCCSEDDEPALAKVVDELLREGMAPELVPGVEFDHGLMSSAVDGAAPGALFVLCTSTALDKAMARKLTGLFSARSGRSQRIITAVFTPSRPLAILPAIRAALKEMRLAEDDAEEVDTEDRGAHLRDVVEAFAEPELPRAPSPPIDRVDAEALARELALGLAEAEAILQRRADNDDRRPSPRSSPRPRTPMPSRSSAPRREAPASPRADARSERQNGTIERHLESSLPQLEALVLTDGEPSRKIPRSMVPAPGGALAEEPQGNRWLLAFAAVGIAGIVVLALLQLLRPAPAVVPSRSAGAAEVPASTADGGARAGGAANDAGAASGAGTANVGAGAVNGAGTGGAAAANAGTGAGTANVGAGTANVGTGTTNVGTGTTNVGVRPDDNVPPPPKDAVSRRDVEEAALALAVTEGKLSRAGRLYVARTGTDEVTWTEAIARCHARRINGISGFRLPGLAELKRLRASKAIGAGSWWSRSKGEAADEAVAYDGGSGASNVYLMIEPNGQAICVRTL